MKDNSNLGDAYGDITRLFSTVTNASTIDALNCIATLVSSSKEKMSVEEHLLGYKDGNGRNVCHFVCSAKRNDTLKAIIKLSPGLANSLDNSNETPLFLSVRAHDIDSVKILLENGADVTLKNTNGCNVLHYACQAGDADIAEIIVSNLKARDPSGIYSFINACSPELGTPLQWACIMNDYKLINYLLNHNADPNLAPVDRKIPSPLMITIGLGSIELTELLLKSGTLIKQASDSEGYTPIFGAVEKNDMELLLLIIEYMKIQSCDVSDQIVKGRSIYSYAININCNEEILEILKSHALDTIKISSFPDEENSNYRGESNESEELNEYSPINSETTKSESQFTDEVIAEQEQDDLDNFSEIKAEMLKSEANNLFKEGYYSESIDKYTKALDHLKMKRENLTQKAIILKSSILANRSLSYIKLRDSSKALFDANSCIYINPKWSKGYYRCSQAYQLQGDVPNQACYLWDAITCEGPDSIIKQDYLSAFSQLMKNHKKSQQQK
ncbi:ankyrin-related protein [Cryptosporidium felis]|nr:ankyrin-related protein [Cryptosporidium felis]